MLLLLHPLMLLLLPMLPLLLHDKRETSHEHVHKCDIDNYDGETNVLHIACIGFWHPQDWRDAAILIVRDIEFRHPNQQYLAMPSCR